MSEPAPMDTPLKLDIPTERPTQAFLDDRKRKYKNWSNSVILTVCVELLRYKNRVRGEKGANRDDMITIVYLTLRPMFPELDTKTKIVDHFEKFEMPAFDRYLDQLAQSTGHDCLLFVYDAIATANVQRSANPTARPEAEPDYSKELSLRGMTDTVTTVAIFHRGSMEGTGRRWPRTQECRLGDEGTDACFPSNQLELAYTRDRDALMASLGLDKTDYGDRYLVKGWMNEAGL